MKFPFTRWLVPVMALAGFAYAVYFTVVVSDRPPPAARQLSMPAESQFLTTVSGSGLVEASSRNVAVGSFLSGIVASVAVEEGQWVGREDELFSLDKREAEAQLAVAERDVLAAEAEVVRASAELADRQDQLQRRVKLKVGVVLSEDQLARLRYAVDIGTAQVAAARAQVEVARARREQARVTLARHTVRAPLEGRVLKINVRPGEFVVAGMTVDPLVLLGNDRPLHVRVQVDENDLWRLRPGAAAEAVVRGNRNIRFGLTFVRVEPYVLPKRSLTGAATERIDTRVLEVIYAFDPAAKPVFIGQQVDVFIDAERH
jgi:RND family efflux transporter MFP subunit